MGGVAEMSQPDEWARERTDVPDTLGNTTASIGKGFAIGLRLWCSELSVPEITLPERTFSNSGSSPVFTKIFDGSAQPDYEKRMLIFMKASLNEIGTSVHQPSSPLVYVSRLI